MLKETARHREYCDGLRIRVREGAYSSSSLLTTLGENGLPLAAVWPAAASLAEMSRKLIRLPVIGFALRSFRAMASASGWGTFELTLTDC